MKWSRNKWRVSWGLVPIGLLLVVGLTPSLGRTDSVTLVKKGHLGSQHWFVSSAGESGRPSVCLLVGIYRGRPKNGVDSGGQCSAPSVKRGIVIGSSRPARGRPLITVVGGAFNRAVSKVESVAFDGTVEAIPLLSRKASGSSAIGRYRYIALAVPGPWCAQRLTTYAGDGSVLWEAEFRQLAAPPSKLTYDPQKVCPQ
jgi:hypothetical protein